MVAFLTDVPVFTLITLVTLLLCYLGDLDHHRLLVITISVVAIFYFAYRRERGYIAYICCHGFNFGTIVNLVVMISANHDYLGYLCYFGYNGSFGSHGFCSFLSYSGLHGESALVTTVTMSAMAGMVFMVAMIT
jgi:hypothetical protein